MPINTTSWKLKTFSMNKFTNNDSLFIVTELLGKNLYEMYIK